MAGPPIDWSLLSFVLSPTGGSARYGAPAPGAGLQPANPEVDRMASLSRRARARTSARERRAARLIWASLLIFVFVAGIASRIWLR
jgi:hypothetical protein